VTLALRRRNRSGGLERKKRKVETDEVNNKLGVLHRWMIAVVDSFDHVNLTSTYECSIAKVEPFLAVPL
jgi:hypothetical protein